MARHYITKSSWGEVLCKKDVLKSLATFTKKHVLESLFNTVAGLKA